MAFQVGDKVVHRSFGRGEVVQLDEKELAGKSQLYYVVEFNQLTLWVPVKGAEQGSLRLPAERLEFKKLFDILRSPSDELAEDRFQRQIQLSERMKEGSTEELCKVVRDISGRGVDHKLNENDLSVMRHAQDLLLEEWQFSQGVTLEESRVALEKLLRESREAGQVRKEDTRSEALKD
jgi:CarD family transcriptional regulator